MRLERANIQIAIDETDAYLERNGIDRIRRTRYRLLLEECLLEYSKVQPETDFEVVYKTRNRKIEVILKVKGESCNVILKNQSRFINTLVQNLDSAPQWRYKRGVNIISYSPKLIIPDIRNIKYLFTFMTNRKKTFVAASFLRFVNMLLAVIEPILTAQIIVAYSGSEISRIFLIALLILLQSGLSTIVTFFASYMLRKSYSTMIKEMQSDITDKVLKIKTSCMDENGSGLFTQRLINETNNAVENVDELLGTATEIFRLISLVISFAIVSPKMLVFEIILFTLYVIIQRFRVRSLTDDGRRSRTADEKHTSFVTEMIRAHRDIKLLHCEDSFMKKLNKSIDNSVNLMTEMRIRSTKFILLRTQFISITDYMYMALLALFMVADGMPPSTALVLFNYNGKVYLCSNAISNLMQTISQLALSSERINQLMQSSDYETEEFGTTHLDKVNGDIEFKDVRFSYRNSRGNKVEVLKGIDLKIKAGEAVALVGQSGCGKSTLLSLLSRLHDPDSGEILIDGHNIRDLDKDTLRGNMEMVTQMPYIFNMSIRDNLAIAKSDITEDQMVEICKMACIYDDIMEMPRGFDTVVGEGGVALSGGQRQRIALARSLLQDYSILMLDEATSALDNITQSKIQAAVESMHGRQTTIMVAHRLSTVINCENIFFIHNGKVLAHGTHDYLLKNCKEYRDLYSVEAV